MLRLHTLGGLAVSGGGPFGKAAAQRKPLALLAILARAGETGASRDRLLALLWSEKDTEHARNALNQTLYSLRRDLGADELVLGGSELRLNPAVISCDASQFDDAIRSGDFEKAVALYQGRFLDGVHLAGTTEFEHWLDAERQRLDWNWLHALETLALRDAAAGEYVEAAGWWRQIFGADPLNGRVALALARALREAGDRAGARRVVTRYEESLREELGVGPDPEMIAFVAELENGALLSAAPARVAHPPPRASRRQAPSYDASVAAMPLVGRPAEDAGTAAPPHVPARPVRHRLALGSSAAALTVFLVAAATVMPVLRHDDAPATLAIAPFRVLAADDTLAFLREGMMDLLGPALARSEDVRVVDARTFLQEWRRRGGGDTDLGLEDARHAARRAGATHLVIGSVVASGPQLVLEGSLVEVESGRLRATASVRARADSLPGGIDRLVAQLLVGRSGLTRERIDRLAVTATASVPALQAFAEGERAMRAGRHSAAASAFRRATTHDSAFALGYYRLALALDWSGASHESRRAVEEATRRGAGLAPRERALLAALDAYAHNRPDNAERGYLDVLAGYPDDLEAQYMLAETRFHFNALRGRATSESRPTFERVLAGDPANADALLHLARLASADGRDGALDSLAAVLASLPGGVPLEVRALRAVRLGRDSVAAVMRAVSDVTPSARVYLSRSLLTFGYSTELADSIARLPAPGGSAADLAALSMLRVEAARARGRWREVRSALRAVPASYSDVALDVELDALLHPYLRMPRDTLVAFAERLAVWRPSVQGDGYLTPGSHAALTALLDAALGDATLVPDSPVSRLTAAEMFARNGESAAALALFEELRLGLDILLTARHRLQCGELLLAAGRADEALRWFESVPSPSGYEASYAAASAWGRARAYARLGRSDSARRLFAIVADAWADADPPLRAIADSARAASR